MPDGGSGLRLLATGREGETIPYFVRLAGGEVEVERVVPPDGSALGYDLWLSLGASEVMFGASRAVVSWDEFAVEGCLPPRDLRLDAALPALFTAIDLAVNFSFSSPRISSIPDLDLSIRHGRASVGRPGPADLHLGVDLARWCRYVGGHGSFYDVTSADFTFTGSLPHLELLAALASARDLRAVLGASASPWAAVFGTWIDRGSDA